jgi:hypothetical protein
MLDALKKLAGVQTSPPELQALQSEFSDYKLTAEALLAQAEETRENLEAQVAALQADLAQYAAFAAEVEAEKAKVIAAAKQAKMDSRLKAISEAIGTEKAGAILEATTALEDAQFEIVVKSLVLSVDNEAVQFKEVGVDAGNSPTIPQEKVAHFLDHIRKNKE